MELELPTYVAITGMAHYYGTSFLKPGQLVHLLKDPDNPHDQEAIKAEIPPIGKIGYVANSTHTVPKGCKSAGRIYDSFEHRVSGIVRFVIKDTVIVELTPNIEEVYVINLMENVSFPLR
ncbi:DNA-binding protein [Paenibacillus mesophilus]|uniref:HIRAN domain-containing protein n=1 Tax=Paenibacillus mesophilus TaxID=2582849 RepID=UPI00110F18B2|nr:HIRAN domain-containing protein [Paenibacillus mesophilus]TMV49571.1 DNA-binding protein [Paenibacillus mesophilus]